MTNIHLNLSHKLPCCGVYEINNNIHEMNCIKMSFHEIWTVSEKSLRKCVPETWKMIGNDNSIGENFKGIFFYQLCE